VAGSLTQPEQRGYARPEALVSTEWLAQRLGAPDIRVVDGSWYLPAMKRDPKPEFLAEHIPGAVYFDIDDIADTDSPLPHMLPSPEKFAARVKKLGLGDGNRIVVYDGLGLFSAARVWWMFRVFGHDDVAVLDGGLRKWKAEGRPIESGAPRPRERHFVMHQRNMEFVPRVLAAPVGATVDLPNDDRIFHNVFSYTNGKPFDLGLYPTGASKRITLDRAAVNRLYCNIHPHMAAYIVAVDTPYYATTGRSGQFAIAEVPAGRYTYHAWRSGAEPLSASVSVGDGQPLEISWR
jgi:plastocyanin